MTRRAVWAIGLGQCVNWGVLYYSFSVLIVPVERDLGVARWVIVGAFSVALLISALAAPRVGRLVDRGHGPSVIQAGGLIAAGLLTLWALAPGVWLSYAVWAALGLCMATVLYEPVFAIVGKAIEHSGDRLRAIATITVFGGFASTAFLPATAALVSRLGWRHAVVVLAAGLAITTVTVHRLSFGDSETTRRTAARDAHAEVGNQPPAADGRPGLYPMIAIFTCSSFASAALATNLVPALIERSVAPTAAASLAGLFGVMQLPGRLLFLRGGHSVGPLGLLGCSLGLQVGGLLALSSSRSFAAIALGVTLFAGGSGLATLARPYLVLVFYGAEQAGVLNGMFARPQHLARAAGPVSAAALAGAAGYGVVFALLAALLAVVTISLVTFSKNS